MISLLVVFVFGVVAGGLAEHYLHPVEDKIKIELTALRVDLSAAHSAVAGIYGHVTNTVKRLEGLVVHAPEPSPTSPTVPSRQVPSR